MEKVDIYISNLLYEHDCVIVPQLGGFVANYSPAQIHPTQHTFTPPSKKIVFNTNIKNNDGLLANHIAQEEKIIYPEALKYINHFVHDTEEQLRNGKKVKISDVGKLFLDVEKNIQFEPDTNTNYLLDSFGLTQFQSPAIKRDTITKRIEKELIDRKPIPAEKRKINVKRYVALALALPLIFGMVWIPLKTDWIKNVQISNLNPFASKEAGHYKPLNKPKTVLLNPEDYSTEALVDNASSDTTKYKIVMLSENSSSPVTIQAFPNLMEAVKADSLAVAVKSTVIDNARGFHIVAGCFIVESNAVNFVEKLKQQKFNASIIGQNEKQMYVVSCGDFATRVLAEKELQKLRNAGVTVWLYQN